MGTVEECTQAIYKLNGHKFGNDRISVEFAKTQEEKDRIRQAREVIVARVYWGFFFVM